MSELQQPPAHPLGKCAWGVDWGVKRSVRQVTLLPEE